MNTDQHINESILNGAKLILCHLGNTNIMHCEMNNCDISTSDITKIKISQDCLNGLLVSENQALNLVSLLGLRIKR